MARYQTWAVDKDGGLLHAGPRDVARFTRLVAIRDVREWERWADKLAEQYPDCPTVKSRRRTHALHVHPIGRPELVRRFEIPAADSVALPLPAKVTA